MNRNLSSGNRSNPTAIVLNEKDNVATLLNQVESGNKISLKSPIGDSSLVALDHVDSGHKIALQVIRKGNLIIKFGETIGEATRDISLGSHVHSHNMRSLHGRVDVK